MGFSRLLLPYRWLWSQMVDDGHVVCIRIVDGVDSDLSVVLGSAEFACLRHCLKLSRAVVVLWRSELAMQTFNLSQALLHGLVGVITDVAFLLQAEADIVV